MGGEVVSGRLGGLVESVLVYSGRYGGLVGGVVV